MSKLPDPPKPESVPEQAPPPVRIPPPKPPQPDAEYKSQKPPREKPLHPTQDK